MKLAFCLFRYFPFGGLQRDFLRIAQEALVRGHTVDVYTMAWEGDIPAGLTPHIVTTHAIANHRRASSFIKKLRQLLRYKQYDVVVGFNKMPGLNIYYAADFCYAATLNPKRQWLYRLIPRYRYYLAQEKSVFSPAAKTQILLLSLREKSHFISFYQTPSERFHLLPPGISRDRIAPADAAIIRQAFRREFNVNDQQKILLMVGSGFRTKGVDRTLQAIAALPAALQRNVLLMIVGDDKEKAYLKKAKRLAIAERVMFLGGRDDVPRFLLGADLLVHPAYRENTGTVLLEAIAAGLPVLASEVCGFSPYISDAKAGLVIPEPFSQTHFNTLLAKMLVSSEQPQWRKNGLQYAKTVDIYRLPQAAVNIIEKVGKHGEI